MHGIRPGLLAYVAFLLACLVPAWHFRPELGTEVQLRLPKPPFGRQLWRDLGAGAAERLQWVLRSDPSRKRRDKARDVLLCFKDPVVRAVALVLSTPD